MKSDSNSGAANDIFIEKLYLEIVQKMLESNVEIDKLIQTSLEVGTNNKEKESKDVRNAL